MTTPWLAHSLAQLPKRGHNCVVGAGMRKDMTGAAVQPAIMEEAQSVGTVECYSSALLLPAQREVPLAPVWTESGGADSSAAIRFAHGAAGAETHETGAHSSSSHESNSDDSCSDDEKDSIHLEKKGCKEVRDSGLERSERKAHKAAVKESNRERRKQKVKKHIKKRAINKHKHK